MNYAGQGNAASVGYAASQNANAVSATPIAPIIMARSSLQDAVTQIHSALDELEKRLDGVLTPQPPSTNNDPSPSPAPPVSEHQRFLQDVGATAIFARTRIVRLLDRLEL